MPSLKDTKRRIVSVKNTQKVTNTMKLVSAAKFARANQAVIASRPYGRALDEMVARLVGMVGDEFESPLTHKRESEKKVLLVIISSDRGLCGGLNTNLFKSTARFIREMRAKNVEIETVAWGKRAMSFAKRLKYPVRMEREKVLEKPRYDEAKSKAEELVSLFTGDDNNPLTGYDAIYVSYVEFKSAMSQMPVVTKLLPIEASTNAADAAASVNAIVEPSVEEVLHSALAKRLANSLFRAFLESSASEHGARMTAMDSATKNAKEVIRKLTIQYNRARQASITKELIEIVSGAEALQ